MASTDAKRSSVINQTKPKTCSREKTLNKHMNTKHESTKLKCLPNLTSLKVAMQETSYDSVT
jgi:hypothetical protein